MRRLVIATALGAAGLLTAGAAPLPAGPPRLDWPLACELGRTCFVQRYLDRDPGPAARDYTCGASTQDGHNGTDIRLRDMADQRRGVDVLAMAAGRVARLRDGEPDVSVRERGLQNLNGANCGNAVVIDHGGGWETQYCHMARGSIRVRPGQEVKAGEPIGRVGLSGETEYPHLHVSVRHGTEGVDPFAPGTGAGGACGSGASLWRRTPPYVLRQVINTGFAARIVDMAAIEAGDLAAPGPDAPVLVAYARLINDRPGDVVSLTLIGPDGTVLAPGVSPALTAPRQIDFILSGKRRPAQGWPRGVYRAVLKVEAAGRVSVSRSWEITL